MFILNISNTVTYGYDFKLVEIIVILIVIIFIYFTIKNKRLKKSKLELERVVEERTAALKHKEQEITDSIKYALRIQLSIIPSHNRVKSLLPKSFIFYKPKDIVSGDFYWIDELDGHVIFGAIDCTGHGVPGAMMSVIGLNLLNQSTQEKKLTNPADILQFLDIGVNRILRQSYDTTTVKDGMDLAICNLDYKTLTLQYAGAFNTCVVVRKNIATTYRVNSNKEVFYGTDLLEIKSDKMPIGSNVDGIADIYTNHTIQLQKNDCVYIYTDGYADQFGGPKGKKFKYNQLKDILIANAHLDIEEQRTVLNLAFKDWKGKQEQVDDVLVIGVKI